MIAKGGPDLLMLRQAVKAKCVRSSSTQLTESDVFLNGGASVGLNRAILCLYNFNY